MRRFLLLGLFSLVPGLLSAEVPTPIHVADDLYQKGNFFDALQAYKSLAEEGDPEAQNKAGMMYRDAQGTERNYASALNWFREAASRNYPSAFINLAFMYGRGLGVPVDYAEEMSWIRKAAEAGDPTGEYDLGVMISESRQAGDYEAQSVSWIQKAARQGYPPALRDLGVRYVEGRGIPRDDHAAYYCLSLAKALGEDPGPDLLAASRRLTRDQVFSVHKEVKDWLRQNAPPKEPQDEASSPDAGTQAVHPARSAPHDPTARPEGY